MVDAPASPLPCPTCGRTHSAGGCWTVSGHKALTTATEHQRQKDQDAGWAGGYPAGVASRDAEVAGLQSSLSLTTQQLEAAQGDLTADATTISDLQAKVTDLTTQLAAAQRPPVVVVGRPVPAAAVYVHPQAGADTNGGSEARPRKTFLGGAYCVPLPADYSGTSFESPAGKITSIHVRDGETVTFDGKGAGKRILTASGKLNLYGDGRIVNAGRADLNINGCPVYYGGTSAGSEIDGWTISNAPSAGLGFQVPLVLTRLTVDGSGYCGILGTSADDMRFGAVRVTRSNRGKNPRGTGGQLSAIKMARSANLRFGPDVYVEDAGGGNGLWTDVSCRNVQVVRSKVLTGVGGIPAYIGLQIEETEGGTVVGGEFEGQYAGSFMASGHIKAWESKFTGTVTALQVKQDRPKNSGTTPGNLTQAQAPWWAVGNMVSNCTLVGPTALACFATTGYDLSADDMLDALKGNTLTGKVSLEGEDGKITQYTPAQLAAYLGAEYDPARQPIPPEIADLLTAA